MRDRSNKDNRKYFAGHKSSAIHVCRHGGANVQGRGPNLNNKLCFYERHLWVLV